MLTLLVQQQLTRKCGSCDALLIEVSLHRARLSGLSLVGGLA